MKQMKRGSSTSTRSSSLSPGSCFVDPAPILKTSGTPASCGSASCSANCNGVIPNLSRSQVKICEVGGEGLFLPLFGDAEQAGGCNTFQSERLVCLFNYQSIAARCLGAQFKLSLKPHFQLKVRRLGRIQFRHCHAEPSWNSLAGFSTLVGEGFQKRFVRNKKANPMDKTVRGV